MNPQDKMEIVKEPEVEQPNETKQEHAAHRFNNLIAITVALLATFMGICSIKAGNVAQAMQQAQVDRNNAWMWYQARNVREEVMSATAAQLEVQAKVAPVANRTDFKALAEKYHKMADSQQEKQKEQKADAEKAEAEYKKLNRSDDQFDISEAALSLSIALMALASLTQNRWLYAMAMIPTSYGIYMGVGGLFGIAWIDPGKLAQLLGA